MSLGHEYGSFLFFILYNLNGRISFLVIVIKKVIHTAAKIKNDGYLEAHKFLLLLFWDPFPGFLGLFYNLVQLCSVFSFFIFIFKYVRGGVAISA